MTNVYSYLILLGTACSCLGQVYFLNEGLKRYPSLHVLPLYQGIIILVGSITGVIFFNEHSRMETYQFIIYPFGIIFTIIGLVYIAYSSRWDDLIAEAVYL